MRRLTIIFVFILIACSSTQQLQTINLKPEMITILHTNDIHGNFLAQSVKSNDESNQKRQLGGVLALNYYTKEIRGKEKNVLLLDAGDFMTGNPICEMEYQGAVGGPMVRFFNYIGYEGMTPGNHEFDTSANNARKLIELCKFPVFSANLFMTDGKLFTEEPCQIYSKGNLVIGVIGAVVNDLSNYLNKSQKEEIFAKPSAPIVDSLAKILDPLTDLIIVLSHSGLEEDQRLAQQLGHQVDVIIGGHSHDSLQEAVKVNRKLIVQAGSNLRNLGRLDLAVVADTVQNYNYQLISLWNEDIQPDTILLNEIRKYEQLIENEYGRIIGELKMEWRRSRFSESNIGNYIADCIRNFSEADLALINSGGVRQDLSVGPIRKLDIKNILPFSNLITKFRISGKQVLELIRTNAVVAATNSNGILQVSGLSYQWKVAENGSVMIENALIGAEKIDPNRIYVGATVDYVITNAEKYFGFIPTDVMNLMMPLTDVVMKSIEQQKYIISNIEGRIEKID